MNIEQRIARLEERIGSNDDSFLILITSLVGCDPTKVGPERAIHHTVTGYRGMRGAEREWTPRPGESLDALRARMEQELKGEGHKVYMVCECYAEGALAA